MKVYKKENTTIYRVEKHGVNIEFRIVQYSEYSFYIEEYCLTDVFVRFERRHFYSFHKCKAVYKKEMKWNVLRSFCKTKLASEYKIFKTKQEAIKHIEDFEKYPIIHLYMNKQQQQILDVINQYGLTKDSLEEMIERDFKMSTQMTDFYAKETKLSIAEFTASADVLRCARKLYDNPFTEKQPTKEEYFEPTGVAKFYSTFGRPPDKSERLFIAKYGVNAVIEKIHSVTIGYDKGSLAQVLSEYTEIVMSQKSNKQFKHKSKFHE